MPKLLLPLLCAFLFLAGNSRAAASDFLKVGGLYRAIFTSDYRDAHSFDSDSTYVIKIDAVNSTNPNWILAEYPASANSSYNSDLAGARWINLNAILELKPYSGN